MRSGQTVRLDFDSTFEMLDLVQVVSDHIARLAGLDEEARHWVNVAVRESVINAIKHGNCNDAAKRVHVEFTPIEPVDTPSGVMIRVRDEGHGFDPASVPDPLAPENLLKGSGRGIFLIRSFMDEMVLQRAEEGGMEMVMVKRASPMQDPGFLSA
jgi:serine/threonine-protein kinase RsbW